jgi:hypothetical protein
MKISRRKGFTFLIILIISFTLIPHNILAWKQEGSGNLSNPNFTTHQWLTQEALELFDENRILWLTDNMLAFWRGIEAPYNDISGYGYVEDYESIYGDIESESLLLSSDGSSVVNDSLAVRAQDEYDKLFAELDQSEPDFELAAFYAGTMSHYVSQAGAWGAIWDNSWGTLNKTRFGIFEDHIEVGQNVTRFDSDEANWGNIYFPDLDPDTVTPEAAENATINLAKNVHSYAEELENDFDVTANNVSGWETSYKQKVADCLEYSIEAIFAVLDHIMTALNWKAINLPEVEYSFNHTLGELTVPEFEANYTDNSGTHIIDDTVATKAEVGIVTYSTDVYNNTDNPHISADPLPLTYSDEKWSLPSQFVPGLVGMAFHSVVYTFEMDNAYQTQTSLSDDLFYVPFFDVIITQQTINYTQERILDIYNISVSIPLIEEIGVVDDTECNLAEWILYTKGEGAQGPQNIGIPAENTQSMADITGSLEYNSTSQTWYSYGNDIGWVFTATLQQYYVVTRFNISDVPVGYLKESSGYKSFVRRIEGEDSKVFTTHDHDITVTTPEIVYNSASQTVSFYDVIAYTDYKNITLDYYQIFEKAINPHMVDRRQAKYKVFLDTTIESRVDGDLSWDYENEYWYAENIWVGALPPDTYSVRCKITNMNVNFTQMEWGIPSNLFKIESKIPWTYWVFTPLFLGGFLTLFFWLAWYRPKQKQEKKEQIRDEHIEALRTGEKTLEEITED